MLKIGMSSCAFELNEASFRELERNEIRHVEISVPYVKEPKINYAETKKLADSHGIVLWSYHLLSEDLYGFAERIASKTVTVHISDYDFINERHWLPGEGKIDWQRIYEILTRNGYEGVWLYEVGLKTPKTIERERDLAIEDFARNARQIFENRPLTVIGRPKKNLGMWA